MRLIPNLILPQVGAGIETVNDAVVHYSIGVHVYNMQEKQVQVYATLAAGAPGNLLVWVELAPENTAAFYTMIGTQNVVIATGSVILAWTIHSEYMRIAVQAPGAGVAAFWTVTGYISAKG